jgi:hypothetical protein
MPEKLRPENPCKQLQILPENSAASNSRNGRKIPAINYRYGWKIPASKKRYGRKILRPVTKETAGKCHSRCHRNCCRRMQWRSGTVSGLSGPLCRRMTALGPLPRLLTCRGRRRRALRLVASLCLAAAGGVLPSWALLVPCLPTRRHTRKSPASFSLCLIVYIPPLLVQKCLKMHILIICSSHFCYFCLCLINIVI